jgi:hypothetical protein
MGINKDLSVAPYFDDLDENKNFHRVLFKPSVAVQARELTQLQTILQQQIERFGDNIIREGSIVKGGNFREMPKLSYVKIRDNNTNNQPIVIGNYVGAVATGESTGLTALVITSLPGLETQAPDLNTLYVRYTRTAQDAFGNDVKQFLPGEKINFTINGVAQPMLSVTVASAAIDPQSVGVGYAVRCGDGIIYQKGHFVRFDDQIVVVSKYDNAPSEVVVGFQTEESIITSDADTSLLDNAQGFNNAAAPGADRLKLVPKLVTLGLAQAQSDETFFAIQEYQDGRLIRRRVETQFNAISRTMEKRTSEESGNYSIGNFELQITENKASNGTVDPDNLAAFISPGVAYVEGQRIELNDSLRVIVPKATEYNTVSQQDIVANYGNYIIANSCRGAVDVAGIPVISLYNAAQTSNTTGAGFSLQGTKIGEAFVRTVSRDSSTTLRLYLFDIKMNSGQSFANVRSFVYNTNAAFGNLVLENGAAVVKDSGFRSLVFPLGRDAIKSVDVEGTDYVYRTAQNLTANSTGGFSIDLGVSGTFPYGASATLNTTQRNDLVVSFTSNGQIVPVTSASTNSTGAVLSGSLGLSLGASTGINVAFNVKKSNVKPIGKALQTVYVRINPAANTTGPYNLGFPDVFSVVGVWKGSNNTFTETSSGISNVTNNFVLVKNDTVDKYDICRIRRKNITIQTTDRFLVKLRVFTKQTTGQYDQSYFTYNSYPIDDVTTPLPGDKIRTQWISSELRNSIDFRPYVANTATYSTTAAGATIWTNANNLASVGYENIDYRLIAPNESVEAQYQYYLGRRDRLIINERGDFVNVVGISADAPTVPNPPQRGMTVAIINIPPFPSLPSIIANRSGNPQYGVTFSREDNKRYTMRDIGKMQKRIERMEYYTVLNALEKSAEDMVIVGADGLDRFKNGILVDSFENLLVGDVTNDDFSASVDPSFKELSPRFRAYDIPLRVSYTFNVVDSGEVITLPYDEVVMIDQPYGTNIRNCVTDYYRYPGQLLLNPEYDGAPDFTTAPDINFDIDLATPFIQFTEALAEFVPLQTVNRDVVITNQSTDGGGTLLQRLLGGNLLQNTTTTTTTTTTRSLVVTENPETNVQRVGDFITDFQFRPFLRAKRVEVFVFGLRPNTRLHAFFDGVNVDQYMAPAIQRSDLSVPYGATGGAFEGLRLVRSGDYGNPLKSNADGALYAIFDLPENTFYVGDREMFIADVSSLENLSASTTTAKAFYRGYNFSVERTGLEISTRMPQIDVEIDQTVTQDVTVRTRRRKDPIAQTFIVEEDYTSDNAVMVTGVDIFFEKKSPTAGVAVEIRNTENGYPGPKVLAFGQARLKASQVNVSANATIPTTFSFPAPVTLAAGEEYCIVVVPEGNDPDYRIWVSRTGGVDVATGLRITQDTNSGMLFTATNDKAWTAYQDEDMKYVLRRAQFTRRTGAVRFVPDNCEFFTISSYSGKLRSGDICFADRPAASGNVSITALSTSVVGAGTSFNSYFTVGDMIAYQVGANQFQVSEVTAIANNTSIQIFPAPSRTVANISNYFKTVAGQITYVNLSDPVKIQLRKSTAKPGSVFADGDVLRTEAGSVAVIDSVENLPVSHFQANLYRVNFTRTTTDLAAMKLSDDSGNYATDPVSMAFGNNNYLDGKSTAIYSRSNEVVANIARSFELRIRLNNTSPTTADTSPIIDYPISSITAYEYFINSANSEVYDSERFQSGLSRSKYISRMVQLANGFDAEDIKLFLTAYRPNGSDIAVYVKFKSEVDPTAFADIPWTRLAMREGSNFSSSANRFDFRELEFNLGTQAPGNGNGAYLNNTQFTYVSSDGVIYTNYKFFAVKILLNSAGQHIIPRVKDMRAIALS